MDLVMRSNDLPKDLGPGTSRSRDHCSIRSNRAVCIILCRSLRKLLPKLAIQTLRSKICLNLKITSEWNSVYLHPQQKNQNHSKTKFNPVIHNVSVILPDNTLKPWVKMVKARQDNTSLRFSFHSLHGTLYPKKKGDSGIFIAFRHSQSCF